MHGSWPTYDTFVTTVIVKYYKNSWLFDLNSVNDCSIRVCMVFQDRAINGLIAHDT